LAHLSAPEILAIINRSLATSSVVVSQNIKLHLPRTLPTHSPVLPQHDTKEQDPDVDSK